MSLKLHNHPQKSSYESESEWPRISLQGHWAPANIVDASGHIHLGHTHLEPKAPLWAEIPKLSNGKRAPFTIDLDIVMFHITGGLWGFESASNPHYGLFCTQAIDIQWDSPSPMVGEPHDVIKRNVKVTIDPNIPFPNGSGPAIEIPENGWFQVMMTTFTQLTNGTLMRTDISLPFYSIGDPSIPEHNPLFGVAGANYTIRIDNGIGGVHGVSICEYRDVMLPILAPIDRKWTIPGLSYNYARNPGYPGLDPITSRAPGDEAFQLTDPDLHNGIPGTKTNEGVISPTTPIDFDPAIGLGDHKAAIVWTQNSGNGNELVPANETLASLITVPFNVGTFVPPTSPVDCQGSWGSVVKISDNEYRKTFNVTRQAEIGGKSCQIVAEESD